MTYKDDLTVIYLTANQHPFRWVNHQISALMEAKGNFPMIAVSREPIIIPGELILDTEPRSHLNMYKQMLKAAKLATTPYIAAAEDDVLYHKSHFNEFRPPLDTFSYNIYRWALFTWQEEPWYNWRDRISNCAGILPRELFIEAWEERLAKFPDGMPIHRVSEVGRNNQEEWMGVTQRKCVKFYSSYPIIHLNHLNGTDSTKTDKRMGPIRARDIPYWGRAERIVELYNV